MSELENLPSNSHTAKEAQKPTVIARGEKVAGSAPAKEGLFKRMVKQFFAMSMRDVANHLLTDVVEPSAKNILSDLVVSAKDLILFGSSASTPITSSSKGTDYNALSKQTTSSAVTISKTERETHNFENVKLPSRKAAIDVLMALRGQLQEFGEVSVGYFYDIVGVESSFPDYTFGWKHLNGADVRQTGAGWMLQLPPVRKLSD